MPSAAILAGGRATRFGGRDKGALVVEGRPIRERQIAELSRLTDDIMLVGGRVAAARKSVTRELRNEIAVRLVRDRVRGCGPMGGLDAALAAARDDRLVLVAGDMPFVTAELLGHLLALTREADIVVPQTPDGYHPLCAAYTRACQPALAARLADRRLKMDDLFADVRVRVVTGDELERFGESGRLLANVNTPAEYEKIEALFGHQL
ncbi:MAG: molybdenum cofactor guanylyltransferase [Chloroflexi bacterium]|nr:molybdenum cofactor guanylyltransferase [Chloroflexota bacterium]